MQSLFRAAITRGLIGVIFAGIMGPLAVGKDETILLSDVFVLKSVTSGVGVYKKERGELYVRKSNGALEYIGTTEGGPPGGVSFLGDSVKQLRASTMAMSADGRTLVYRHWSRKNQKSAALESGIYQYVNGRGRTLLIGQEKLSGDSYRLWERPLPTDCLSFKYRTTYTPNDLLWAVDTEGKVFPFALYASEPLHWAAFEGRAEDCEALIKKGATINGQTYWGFTPLDLAIIRNHETLAIQLLALGASERSGIYPAFHRAVMLGRMEVVNALLERKTDVNATDAWGYTQLHLAVFTGTRQVGEMNRFFENTETPRSISEKGITLKLVERLLNAGADPEKRDNKGQTPLEAIHTFTPAGVKELLLEKAKR